MNTKRPKLKPSDIVLPARMSLNVDALRAVRFATLDFPFANALETFTDKLQVRYNATMKRSSDTRLDYEQKPSYRQLSQAIMACCPVLVHAFERYGKTYRMVAINRLERDPETNTIIDRGSQYPDVTALTDLIELWIDHWLDNTGLRKIVDETMPNDLAALKAALQTPETEWQPNVTLDELIADLDQDDAMGYNVIPAIVIALLHGQTMTLTEHGGNPIPITWRKAHDGGTKGLHLVSQPFYKRSLDDGWDYGADDNDADDEETFKEGHFVYRLDVQLETQVGRIENGKLKPWIFLKVGMRRYAHEMFRKDKHKRNISVLLGFNREQMQPENRERFAHYPYDSTLIKLSVDRRSSPVWADYVARLLSSYGLSTLNDAGDILNAPAQYGNLENKADFKGNEYYVIHAEGRAYSDGNARGHKHQVNVGLSLKERTEITQRALELLPDVLTPDAAFQPDIQAPKGNGIPDALRDYAFFETQPRYTPEKTAEKVGHTFDAIRRAIQTAGKDCLDIALIYNDSKFLEVLKAKIYKMFPDCDSGDSPFIHLHEVPVSALLLLPLDSGELNAEDNYRPATRAKDFLDKWAAQMKAARHDKVENQWLPKLCSIHWRPNTHRMALIESYYDVKGFKAIHESQEIKGAVREACCHEGIASQFIGHFDVKEGKVSRANDGRLESAILDLLLRGTGAIYGKPSDLYDRAAELLPLKVPNLDVVAFWHVWKNTALRGERPPLITVVAVRLRANGHVDVIAPGMKDWIPYAQASVTLGNTFAGLRSKIRSQKGNYDSSNYLRMSNKAVMRFVLDVLQRHLDAPTIAVIRADWWRNARFNEYDCARWPQLGNRKLFATQDVLDFSHLPGGETFTRNDPRFNNLLAVIRLRMDSETPQYTVGTDVWDAGQQTGDVDYLSGYIDCNVTEPMHYFSLAGESDMQDEQSRGELEDGYKTVIDKDYGYKHAQLVELLPFFVRDDFRDLDDRKVLCRCVHFLRISPAFSKSYILLPYPMHLAKKLLTDLMCIVDAE